MSAPEDEIMVPQLEKPSLTPERVEQILVESMKNKIDLDKSMGSQFELSPRGSSLRLNECRRTK